MLKNYVLGAEVATKGDFHIANISMLFKDLPLVEGIDYLKFGGITLLSKDSYQYPNYIRNIMLAPGMTDLSDLLPLTYFKDILENNITMVKDSYEIIKIEDKKFVRVDEPVLKEVLMREATTKSVVGSEEIEELYEDNLIKGHMPISKKKTLVWY